MFVGLHGWLGEKRFNACTILWQSATAMQWKLEHGLQALLHMINVSLSHILRQLLHKNLFTKTSAFVFPLLLDISLMTTATGDKLPNYVQYGDKNMNASMIIYNNNFLLCRFFKKQPRIHASALWLRLPIYGRLFFRSLPVFSPFPVCNHQSKSGLSSPLTTKLCSVFQLFPAYRSTRYRCASLRTAGLLSWTIRLPRLNHPLISLNNTPADKKQRWF